MMPSAPQKSDAAGDARSELWTLYRAALDDRNFQVNINWDRTKHYSIFNVGLISIAGGIAQLGGGIQTPIGHLAVVVLFGFAALHSFFAVYSIKRGHEYYRQSRRQLIEVQRRLGLIGGTIEESPLALMSTRGMRRAAGGDEKKHTAGDWFTIVNLSMIFQGCVGVAATYVVVRLVLR